MDRKRAATEGPSSDAKRPKIKSEFKGEGGGDFKVNLSSIPMAPPPVPPTILPPSVAPQVTFKPQPQASSYYSAPRAPPARKRGRGGNSITTWRGEDKITAHWNRKTEQVEFTVSSWSRRWHWDPKEVEIEIFDRLREARFPLRPMENWGFLQRHKGNDRVNHYYDDRTCREDFIFVDVVQDPRLLPPSPSPTPNYWSSHLPSEAPRHQSTPVAISQPAGSLFPYKKEEKKAEYLPLSSASVYKKEDDEIKFKPSLYPLMSTPSQSLAATPARVEPLPHMPGASPVEKEDVIMTDAPPLQERTYVMPTSRRRTDERLVGHVEDRYEVSHRDRRSW